MERLSLGTNEKEWGWEASLQRRKKKTTQPGNEDVEQKVESRITRIEHKV